MVTYMVPPADQRKGGIDTALDGLCSQLSNHGYDLTKSETVLPEQSDFAHFHGLWQPQHRKAYAECRRRHVPYVISPHGMLEPWAWKHKIWKKWPYYQLVERSHLRRASAVLAASQLEAENLSRFLPNERIHVLPFGISESGLPQREEARARMGLSAGDRVLLYFSRIDRKKGLDLLLEALLQNCIGDDWKLVIVGTGDSDFTDALHSFARRHQTELPAITWAGAVWGAERWDYLVGADLFCLPTHSENFGFSVLESLWAGTPVITTSATPWAAHDDVDGINICDSSIDSIQAALTRATTREFADRSRSQLRKWCRDHYHWDVIARKYSDTYLELAEMSLDECLIS